MIYAQTHEAPSVSKYCAIFLYYISIITILSLHTTFPDSSVAVFGECSFNNKLLLNKISFWTWIQVFPYAYRCNIIKLVALYQQCDAYEVRLPAVYYLWRQTAISANYVSDHHCVLSRMPAVCYLWRRSKWVCVLSASTNDFPQSPQL